MKATANNTIIAESDNTVVVENNHYFPIEDIKMEHLKPTASKSVCSWKGEASYYSVEVDGEVLEDAAWEYKEPKEGANEIKGKIAFWKGVEVKEQ